MVIFRPAQPVLKRVNKPTLDDYNLGRREADRQALAVIRQTNRQTHTHTQTQPKHHTEEEKGEAKETRLRTDYTSRYNSR